MPAITPSTASFAQSRRIARSPELSKLNSPRSGIQIWVEGRLKRCSIHLARTHRSRSYLCLRPPGTLIRDALVTRNAPFDHAPTDFRRPPPSLPHAPRGQGGGG